MKKKNLFNFISVLIIFSFIFTSCKIETNAYQNQFLNRFGIDFISTKYETTKHENLDSDKLKYHFFIKLNESEKLKMKEFISASNSFYSISENKSDYNFLTQTLEDDFSVETEKVSNGYFSIYNDISNHIIDLNLSNIKNIDMSFYTAIIYDSKSDVLYLFNFSLS